MQGYGGDDTGGQHNPEFERQHTAAIDRGYGRSSSATLIGSNASPLALFTTRIHDLRIRLGEAQGNLANVNNQLALPYNNPNKPSPKPSDTVRQEGLLPNLDEAINDMSNALFDLEQEVARNRQLIG